MSESEKRVAWITGGGSGIGLAGAHALAASGWTVVISGRRKDVLDAAASTITDCADAMPLDVGNAAAVEDVARAIAGKYGRIDLLVNSAGLNIAKRRWEDVTTDDWDKVVEINLNGVMYCMRAVLPTMRAQKDGCIINIASWAGRHLTKLTGPAYTATKHAVLALTHSFNMDEFKNGLRATCLSPGDVATPIMSKRPTPPSPEEMARMLQPEDVGRFIAFVASMPARVCVNEILISPTWNRGFAAAPVS